MEVKLSENERRILESVPTGQAITIEEIFKNTGNYLEQSATSEVIDQLVDKKLLGTDYDEPKQIPLVQIGNIKAIIAPEREPKKTYYVTGPGRNALHSPTKPPATKLPNIVSIIIIIILGILIVMYVAK